jgi:radical SAM superfamily enzyme YgiQ (UPF0313 family)
LNISLLASFIRERGDYECSIIDFETKEVSCPSELANIILGESPKYVCLTTLTPRYPTVVRIAQQIKQLDPEVVTIVGGPHVTGSPQTTMYEGISYGIIGEGEEALLELLNTLEKGNTVSAVKNLVYRDNGTTKANEARPFIRNLDELPFPAWDLMELDEYLDPAYFEGTHLATFSGRGCPYDCSFCASCVTWRRKLRLKSVENVMNEIRHIVDVLGINNLMFWDDSFAANKKRAIAICNSIIEERINLNYTVQIRADSLSEDLAAALRDSGCSFAAIGVESGNDEILKRIGKKETKAQLRRAVKIMKEASLPVIASYIIGLPGDTHETIKQTRDFAFELDANQSKFMILAPYPGTRVYDMAVRRGLVDPMSFEQMESLNYYDSVAINLSEVSDEDLIRYQDEAYSYFDELKPV